MLSARTVWTSIVLLSLSAAGFAENGDGIELGDKAPELNVHFLKGEPITLEEGAGNHVYIVEFWATWCGPCIYSIPHLTKLQEKYGDDGLVVIGISDESSVRVRPYMEERGEEMDYRVAIDRNDTTHRRYFRGFGLVQTIPRAFVIDGNGRIAWTGHPMQPFMEELVQTLLSDLPNPEPGLPNPDQEDSGTPSESEK